METARKFASVRKRIEMMVEEMRLLSVETEDIIKETEEFHAAHFATFDILDRDMRLAERSATDRVHDARALRGSVSQLLSNLESEARKFQDRQAFDVVA